MNTEKIRIENIDGRKICVAGIGKMFYQDGFPISVAISELAKHGVEVSIFHVADECLKHGWNCKTTFNKLKTDLEEDIDKNNIDVSLLQKFIYSDYLQQREMIYQYLFAGHDTRNWFFQQLTQ
jgi:hypothetical protein